MLNPPVDVQLKRKIALLALNDDPIDTPGRGRYGGSHVFVFDLARYLVRSGHRVDIITRRDSKDKPHLQTFGDRCRIHRLDIGEPVEMEYHSVGELDQEIRASIIDFLKKNQINFDIVHSYCWPSGNASIYMKEIIDFRFIHSILSMGRLSRYLKDTQKKCDKFRDQSEIKIFNSADLIIAVSPQEVKDLRFHYPEIRHDRFAIVPYGVDEEKFTPRTQSSDNHFLRAAADFSQGIS